MSGNRMISFSGITLVGCVAALAACSHMPMTAKFSQDKLPAAIRVPAGHKVVFESIGTGQLTYECRSKATAPDQHEWVFMGPQATLTSRSGAAMGSYFPFCDHC